jgi:hypothetical protein
MTAPYYRIDLKNIPQRYEAESLLSVLPASPLPLKREVEKFARYFRREFDFDIVPFDVGDREHYTAYLFSNGERSVWVGACCFRTSYFEDIDLYTETLKWVWLHPYFRRSGVLSSCWKTLRDNHGDFYIDTPVSPPMQEFLRKHNKDSAWYSLLDGKEPDLARIKAAAR